MGLFTKSTPTVAVPETTAVPPAPRLITPSQAELIAPTPAALQQPKRTEDVRPMLSGAALERANYLSGLKVKIHQKLVERLDVQNLRTMPPETVRGEVRMLIRDLCQSEKGLINGSDQEKLMDDVMDETFGLGPLEILLKDPTISDILVNRWDRIFCERQAVD